MGRAGVVGNEGLRLAVITRGGVIAARDQRFCDWRSSCGVKCAAYLVATVVGRGLTRRSPLSSPPMLNGW